MTRATHYERAASVRRSSGHVVAAIRTGLALACCLAAGSQAEAQPATVPPAGIPLPIGQPRPASVRGNVRDSSNSPISYATVGWGEPLQTVRTSDSGAFEISGLTAGRQRFNVRRLGYTPVDFELDLRAGSIKPVVVSMVPVAAALSNMTVAAQRHEDADAIRAARFEATGFFDRMARRPGYFIAPDEVERRQPAFISDLMRNVPGVRIVGQPHSGSLKYYSANGQCRLKLYLDGHSAPEGDDWVPGTDVKAVEVYNNLLTVPEAFMPSPLKGYCGSVIVWTK